MKHAADTEFSEQNTQHVQGSEADLPSREVMGLSLVDATAQATIESILAPGRKTVAFLNAHCANVMARDPSYADALHRADMVLPDGIGVELAARMTGQRLAANLNGTDFAPALLRTARQRGLSVFLFGGTPGTAERAADRLCRDMPGLRVVGTRDGYAGAADEGAAIDVINASGADILIVAMGVPLQDVWLARNAERLTPRVRLGVGALLDFLAGNVRRAPHAVRKTRCEWVWRLAIEPRRMARRYLVGNATFMARAALHALRSIDPFGLRKRLLDLALAGLAAVALSPLLLLVILAIRLDSPGPAFYRQTRVGKDGTPFSLLKFRSMHTDAEEQRAALLAQSDRTGICFKSRNDPRVTRIGRFLRRSSLDELPQIFNVLRGEMSLVGPRPALPQEVAAYPAEALGRLRVKPGITGLWQVSGRADICFDKMINMDLAYGASRSTLLDLMIIFLTFRTVLSGRGAY